MKGVPGLMIALGLGIVGAFCNWLYLAQKGQELERVDFIVIEEGTKINPGDKFNESHFARISIPRNAVGNLERAAPGWGELQTIVGMAATKSYSPGEIVLRQHLKTLPENDIKKLLAPDEVALSIPVDTRTFVSSLLSAGDQVSFKVPPMVTSGPPLADESSGAASPAPAAQNMPSIIGPYRILALGNRLGSKEVLTAVGASAAQENIMSIAVKMVGNELDARGQQISELLRLTNMQQVQVLLHPPSGSKVTK